MSNAFFFFFFVVMGAFFFYAGATYLREGFQKGTIPGRFAKSLSREREPAMFWFAISQSVIFAMTGLVFFCLGAVGMFGFLD